MKPLFSTASSWCDVIKYPLSREFFLSYSFLLLLLFFQKGLS
jgi:hypothetical protein